MKSLKGEKVLKICTVNIPEAYIEAIAKLVGENGIYPSRSELVRCAVRKFLMRELKMAKKIMNYEEPDVDDFDSEHYVRVPIIDSKNPKEPVREFKVYRILRRLEY